MYIYPYAKREITKKISMNWSGQEIFALFDHKTQNWIVLEEVLLKSYRLELTFILKLYP